MALGMLHFELNLPHSRVAIQNPFCYILLRMTDKTQELSFRHLIVIIDRNLVVPY